MKLSTNISEFEKPLPNPKPFLEKADILYDKIVSTNRGRVVFVVGELGRGKSSLMRSIVEHFQKTKSCNVIDGCFIDGKYEPYIPQIDVDAVQTVDTIGNIASTISEFIPSHYKAFFNLGGQILQAGVSNVEFLKAHSVTPPQKAEAPYWLLQLLRETAKEKPLVCVIDDYDEAQESFGWNSFLEEVAEECAVELPILFIVSISGKEHIKKENENESRIEYMTRYLVHEENQADWWYINPLSREEIAEWIRLETDLGIVSQLHGITSGNPFWIRTLWQQWRINENVGFNEHHQIWQWAKDNKPELNQLKGSFKNQIRMLLKTSDKPKINEAIHILGLAALEGKTFTLDVLALALNKDTEELEDYIDDHFVKHDDQPNGILLVADALELDTDPPNSDGYCRYTFASDWHWHILNRYTFTHDSKKFQYVNVMIQAMKIFFESNERFVAREFVRLYKIIKDDDSANHYKEIADYEMRYDVMREYALAILNVSIKNTNKNRCRHLGKFLLKAGIKIRGANPYKDLTIFSKTLELAKKGEDFRIQGEALYVIGWILCQNGNFAEAEKKAKEAEKLFPKVKNKLFKATVYSLFGLLYQSQGQYEKAEPFYLTSLQITKNLLGENHPNTASSYHNLASLYHDQEKYDEAEKFYKKSLAIREKVLGKNNLDTGSSYHNLASLYQDQGKYEEAEKFYKESLAIHEKELGENHPDTATSYNNLGVLYQAQGKYDEAENYYKKSLAIREKKLGENHLDTGSSYNGLANLYRNQGKYDEAEKFYKKSLVIHEKVLGKNIPSIGTSYHNLASLYHNQGKYDEAENYFLKALAIREKVLGKNHPDTAISYSNFGILRFNQEKYQEALELCEKALAIFETTLPEEHLYIQNCKSWIEDIKEALGK